MCQEPIPSPSPLSHLDSMASSLVSNPYLEESANKIRPKLVPWEVLASITFDYPYCDSPTPCQGYQRAGLASADEIALIKKIDRQPRAKTESLLLSDGSTYILLYLRLLKKLQRIDTMQCILILITDALLGAVFIDPWSRRLISYVHILKL